MNDVNLDKIPEHPELKNTYKTSNRNIFKSYGNVFANYFTFSGRASRYEYWSFILVNAIISLLIALLPIINVLYSLAVIIPTLAVTSRRLHDINKSFLKWYIIPHIIGFFGMFWFYANLMQIEAQQDVGAGISAIIALFVAMGYGVVLFVFTCLKGDRKDNKYGLVPID